MKKLKCFQHWKWDIIFKKLISVWYLTLSFHFLLISFLTFILHYIFLEGGVNYTSFLISVFFLILKLFLNVLNSGPSKFTRRGGSTERGLSVRPTWVRIPSPLPHNCREVRALDMPTKEKSLLFKILLVVLFSILKMMFLKFKPLP